MPLPQESFEPVAWWAMGHEAAAVLGPDFVVPTETDDDPPDDAWQRGEGDWDGGCPPEDCAIAPSLAWTDEQRDQVLAALRRDWEEARSPDAEVFEVSWPPSGTLWTEGFTDEETGHVIEPAEWRWCVRFLTSLGDEYQEQIMTTRMDPRDVW